MPRSEFDDVLAVDTKVHARGPVTEADDAKGPIRILWMVEQDGTVASGLSEVHGDEWHDHADAEPGVWRDGPATAAGVVVTLNPRGTKTFAWSQKVTLRNR